MADFFTDLINGIAGIGPTPTGNILDPNTAIANTYAAMQANLPALNSYNQQLALGNANALLGYRNAINPNENPLLQATTNSFLDNLNTNGNLTKEGQQNVLQGLLETGSASGFGYSPSSLGNVSFQTELQRMNRDAQNRNAAANFISQSPLTRSTFNPRQGVSPQEAFGYTLAANEAQNAINNSNAQSQFNDQQKIWGAGARILGGAAGAVGGAFAGNPAMGAAAGMQAGNILFPQSGGAAGAQGANGGLFTSLLSIFGNQMGGIGGPQYGIGGGQWYAGGPNNVAMQSVRPSPVTLG